MHITKNVCANTLNTLMDIEGFTSHTPGHATLGNQEGAASHGAREWPVQTFGCVMDIEEGRKRALISFFNELKVPMGYYANPKRLVNIRELKFNYGTMKAHDYHVIMTQLLPVALCGILPPKVRAPIIKLCLFFNAISKKVIDVSTLEQL